MYALTVEELTKPHPHRVVVVGSGYSGMTAVVSLAHRTRASDELQIVMVAPLPYQQALSELDLVAAGTPRPQWAELWHGDILGGLDVGVCYERLENVCTNDRCIVVGPPGGLGVRVPYWRLVLATGAVPHVPPVAGLAEHGLTMWSVADAFRLQQRVEAQFTRAATFADAAAQRQAMSIAVVGAGATGVEIVGTLAYALPRMLHRLGYARDMVSLHLIDARPEILYDLRPPERARALARLHSMGVRTHLGSGLRSVTPNTVELESGEIIPAETCVWCGGAHADPDAVSWGLVADNSGRLVVEHTLKAKDHDDIYAVGDVSAFTDASTGRILPMLAQFAIREAAHAAANVIREARSERLKEFEPHQHGEFVSVGPWWGVGWMFRFPVHGWFAIVMKRLTYIMYWLEVGTVRLAWRRAVQMLSMHRY